MRTLDIPVTISVDEVFSEIELVDALKWYKRDLGKEEFARVIEEELEELKK